VLTILTFTFERWLHICKAIYAKKFSSGFSRALKIIVFIWSLSGLLALPYAITTGVYYKIDDYEESKTCNTLIKYNDLMIRVIQLSVFFLFIVPMTLISIMYVLIGITLWKSHTKKNYTNRRAINSRFRRIFLRRNMNANMDRSDDFSVRIRSKFGESLILQNGKKSLANDYSVDDLSNLNTQLTVNHDRTSKEFEHISYRARQSRRDVVKMLCKQTNTSYRL
jgi:hypothetical protein